jgi:hypothetical protein
VTAPPPVGERPTPVDAVRAFAVMLGGSVALAGVVVASVAATGRALRRGGAPPRWAGATLVATVLYATVARPWLRQWGATAAERRLPLPGDDLVPEPAVQSTRAVTVHAPASAVWPWLAQIGQDRGGFYSYEWLENLAGCRMKNADRIHPEWQRREVGDTVMLHWASGLPVALYEPGEALGLAGWGVFALRPIDPDSTRLLARQRQRPGPGRWAYSLLLELPHFVMERGMLLGVKRRVEQAAGGPAGRHGGRR